LCPVSYTATPLTCVPPPSTMPTLFPPVVTISSILGHYRVEEKIGSGGMGEVYRASDDRLGREVALKILKPELAKDPDRLRRFEQEARAAAALSHPNIVAIYDIGLHDGAPYIVSELLEGETLRHRLVRGPISPRQTADYGQQIAQGLVAAHQKHIVHRDLKPENIFITRDGRVKILDFGIAKLTIPETAGDEGRGDRSIETLTTQTRAGAILGTASYMSPEQVRGKPVDHRSDIFSLGAILYEMLTGKRAFKRDSDMDTMLAVLQDDPAEVTVEGSISPAFEQIVRHCLEKEPENRFQSMRDLGFALSTVSANTTSRQFIPLWALRKRLRKWVPWLAAALLLAATGVLVGVGLKRAPSPVYRRITFERGTVYSARFSPDGQGILYGASWNGHPLQLYSSVGDSPLARPLGLFSASLLAVSRTNELALVLHGSPDRREFIGGVLAQAPLAGGTPRELLEGVRAADWSPGGDLAVVHFSENQSRLEFPIGRVLYQSAGWINHLRFSPDGKQIAFMDHPAPWDDRGSVWVTDLSGRRTILASGWESEDGLAWSPTGREVWFTAVENSSTTRALWAVDLSGRTRRILTVPGDFTLQDLAADGRVLVTVDTERTAMEWAGAEKSDVRNLSWYDWSIAKDISPDGQWVLFEESSEPVGPNYAVAIRKIDGSPPIRLGEGTAGGLSPDGKRALAVSIGSPPHMSVLPIGPGRAQQIYVPQLERLETGGAQFLPDGKHVVVSGNEPGHAGRSFVLDLAGGAPRPVTPEGTRGGLVSPNGKYLVGAGADRKPMLYPIEGGDAIPVRLPSAERHYDIARWSSDGKALFVYLQGEIPLHVYRFDLATATMTLLRELTPTDRAGVVTISPVVTTPTGSEFAYSYLQSLSVLYVISGLR